MFPSNKSQCTKSNNKKLDLLKLTDLKDKTTHVNCEYDNNTYDNEQLTVSPKVFTELNTISTANDFMNNIT